MRVGDDTAPAAERHHGRVDHFGEFEDFLARMDRAAADKDHRPLAGFDERGGRLDSIRIGQWCGEQIERPGGADLRTLGEHVPRHFQRHRTAAARQHFLKRARDHGGRDIGIFDALGPFHEGAKRCQLIRHLVQMAAALAQKWRRHLAGQAQHRLVRSECGEQRRTCVEHAGTGHHAEHAGAAGRSRIAIGHVAAGLLVAGADHLQLRLMEGVEQAVDLRAGQAEHGIDAMRDEAIDDCFAAGS